MSGIETEYKLLIKMPETEQLKTFAEEIWQIEQTYLLSDDGSVRRVRHIVKDGKDIYVFTSKERLSVKSAVEKEREISAEEFEQYLAERDPRKNTICKTRYRGHIGGYELEFDIYPFWTDRAILEIETEDEFGSIPVPGWVRILKDVTWDSRYKNNSLAVSLPQD